MKRMDEVKDKKLLRKFMREFFPFTPLRKAGFFTPEMKGDYEAQAKRVCERFGYNSVFEYGAKEIRCHLTMNDRQGEPFITHIKSIYD